MVCQAQGPEPCSQPPATWYRGSCRWCEPSDERARYGLPRGVLLDPDRCCPECHQVAPPDDTCHRCSGPGQRTNFWEQLGPSRPPSVSMEADAVGLVLDEIEVSEGQLAPGALDHLRTVTRSRGAVLGWWVEMARRRSAMERLGQSLPSEEKAWAEAKKAAKAAR